MILYYDIICVFRHRRSGDQLRNLDILIIIKIKSKEGSESISFSFMVLNDQKLIERFYHYPIIMHLR
jgi:hypothetical protein